MNQEQSLKTNSSVDEQFSKFVEPKEATIQIAITTDTRMTGTNRLAYLISQLLVREGYLNVAPVVLNTQPPGGENHFLLDQQKSVRIEIEDPIAKYRKEHAQ